MNPPTSFKIKLDDIGMDLTTGSKSLLGLDDVYVYPDFVEDDILKAPDPARKKKVISGNDIVNYINEHKRVIIEGTEKSGRTALCKQLFKVFHSLKIYPIYIDCKELRSTDFSQTKKIISEAVKAAYGSADAEAYYQLSSKMVILDNYHVIEMNKGKKVAFINNLKDIFSNLVIISEPFSVLHTAGESVSFTSPIIDFKYLNIRLLGPKKRHEIVTRWFAKDNILFENSLQDANCIREAERTLDRIVGSNLIPPHPSYVLLVLQGHINGTTSVNELGAYGYFYEMLIWRTLLEGYSQAEMGEKINILSEIAYYIFSKGLMSLSRREAVNFAEKYQSDYLTTIDIVSEIDKFVNQKIMSYDKDKNAFFKRDYLFYYFLAKYLAKGLGNQIRKQIVSADIKKLVSSIHDTRNSSVLMFLSYLSKDDIIIEEITKHAKNIFSEFALFNFETGSHKIEELNYIPTVTTRKVNPKLNREERMNKKEENYHNGNDNGAIWYKNDKNADPCEYWVKSTDLPMKIAIAIKTMQVMGQLVTNFQGELLRDSKIDLVNECYSIALRTLTVHYKMIFDCLELFKADFYETNKKALENKTDEQKETYFKNVITQLCFGLLLSTINRISDAVGSNKLMKVYDEITRASKFPKIRQMIALAIKMDYATSLPIDDIISFYHELVKGKQKIAAEALRHLVAEFLYYFSIKETDRQKLCQNLSLNIKFLSRGQKQDIGERV